MNGERWHCYTVEETAAHLKADLSQGLTTHEAQKRLKLYGYNELPEKEKTIWWKTLLAQFQDFMVLVLLGATLISAIVGEYVDAITILAIVLLNALLGFVQEYRAERSIEALKQLTAPVATVIRNGFIQQVPARELVPGDVMVHESGDRLAADARIVEAYNFELEEAALTGESIPTRKMAEMQLTEDAPLGDRKNMLYAGTSITRGRGKSVVCATGLHSEVGRIAGMIHEAGDDTTPLQQRLEHLGRWLVWGCLAICLLVVVVGIFKGEPLFLMCMAGISLAVAAIPEGLPAIVTVCLTLGVQRMIKRNAIVRKLPAVETLGCVTVICSDKTGTLTQNAMTVRRIYQWDMTYEVTGGGYDIQGDILHRGEKLDVTRAPALKKCLEIGSLCNNSVIKRGSIGVGGLWRKKAEVWTVEGDPTEGALTVVAAKAGIWREEQEKSMQKVAEFPFESERRRMSVLYRDPASGLMLFTKGAPDTILHLCKYYLHGTKEQVLTAEIAEKILEMNESMASDSLRVLAMAYRRVPEDESGDLNPEQDLVFAGLAGMIDPPREEAKQAVALCRQAGIKTIMITGDHPKTAVAIAKELRIYYEGMHKSLSGSELDALSDKELYRIADTVTVYARVSPAHKLRIVKALRQRGHIVAMTGDGVNDAPAVKEADIGIAMGVTGTDVTKEASSMILADDNFASIVAAVEQGRGIYDNIRKFIRYLLSCNTGEVLIMFMATLVGLPLPLLPVQVLWVNLVTDGLPALALGLDPSEPNNMQRPPRLPNESLFSRGLGKRIMFRGIQIGLSTIFVFGAVYFWRNDLAAARTMAFTTLVFCQIFHVFECRSEMFNIFEIGFFSNLYLVFAVICSTIMQLMVIYTPALSNVFATVPLTVNDWLLVVAVSGWTMILNLVKYLFFRRRKMYFPAATKYT
ncbi:calcium-transporting P-type ATPase, PMR1-type [Acetonema longum]|uniref:P-type Ca(2+) transporter n=1 Tax=Acetonema longum DSM 6540 TaxID=1009370 RepID=F7NLD2_9FIRM|nr:calcium-transporting P-type ATPase, PMR1-type [Acetonema longum]EGO63237.1 cation transport ATPase [Acetonema longum DSM 6540]